MLDNIEFSISLIRHGQSEVNVCPNIIGQGSDVKLTELGKQQAFLLGKRFDREGIVFDHVYSSTYLRALDTAKISLADFKNNIIEVEELREYDCGDWKGHDRKETLNNDIRLKMGYLNMAFMPPNGETQNMVERRASNWLENTILYNDTFHSLCKYRKDTGNSPMNIAVYSHGVTIRCLLHYVAGFDRTFLWKIDIDNTSISKLSFNRFGWRICSINDCGHLK